MQKDSISTLDTITHPTSEMANFFREIQLTINIIRGIQDQYRIDAVLPDSLRGLTEYRASYDECVTLIDVLREMTRFIEENRQHYEHSNKELSDLLKTVVSINEGRLSLTTLNTELDKDIRKFCASKGYKL